MLILWVAILSNVECVHKVIHCLFENLRVNIGNRKFLAMFWKSLIYLEIQRQHFTTAQCSLGSDDLINREPTTSIIYKWLSCQIFSCYCKLFKITVIAWGNLTFILQFVSQPSKIFHFRCCALLSTNTCQTCHHFRIKGVASVGNFILQFGFSFWIDDVNWCVLEILELS